MKSGDELLFSVIIPNLNKAENLPKLLKSIFENYRHKDLEVLLMDDRSSDQSVEISRKFPVRVYESSFTQGPAKLRNQGGRLAGGRFLIFMDSDVILMPDTLTGLRELCLHSERIAITGLETLPCAIDNWIGTIKVLQTQELLGTDIKESKLTKGWGSTFGMIRKDIFIKTGGFNESYSGADIEDHELCLRMQSYPLHLEPSIRYRHSYPSLADVLKKQFRRAAMMAQLDYDFLQSDATFFQTRFKIGHFLTLAVFATAAMAVLFPSMLLLFIITFILKCSFHHFLIRKAFETKGVFFAAYAIAINTATSLFAILGFGFGFVKNAALKAENRVAR